MNRMEESSDNYFLPVSILIAAVLISGSIFYSSISNNSGSGTAQINQQQAQVPSQGTRVNVSVDDDPALGDKDAPVVIVEFSDYQCPF